MVRVAGIVFVGRIVDPPYAMAQAGRWRWIVRVASILSEENIIQAGQCCSKSKENE